jgi:hypothetical protein
MVIRVIRWSGLWTIVEMVNTDKREKDAYLSYTSSNAWTRMFDTPAMCSS